MTRLKCNTPFHWAIAGAILAPVLVGGLGEWGLRAGGEQRLEPRLLSFLLLGPVMALQAGWWLAIPAGAATGYLLCRVQRAFAPQQSTAPAANS